MDFKKILTDSGVSLFRKMVSMARGILVVPIITKLIGVDTYGIWTLVFSLITIFSTIGGMHLHGALIRYRPTEEREGQTISDLLAIAVVTAAIAGFALPLIVHASGFSVSPETAQGLGLVGLAALVVVAKIIGLLIRNIPRAENHVKTYELITISEQALQTVALLATLTITQNIAAGLLSMLVSMVVVYVIVLVYYLPSRLRFPNLSRFDRYLAYCSPMVLKELSSKLLSESDRFIILFFMSPVEVGIYSVAYGASAMLPNLTGVFNSTLYPSITSAWDDGEKDQIERFYHNFLVGYVLLAIPALFGLTLLASPILRLLSTEQVAREGWILVPLITISFIFRGFENVLTYVLNAAEETEKVAVGTTLAFVTNFVINVALIPVVGLVGAAVAMVAGMAIRLGYIYYYVAKHVTIPIPTRRIAKSTFSATVMMAILLFGLFHPDQVLFQLVLYPLVGATVYFVVVYYVGGITKRDIDHIRSLLG